MAGWTQDSNAKAPQRSKLMADINVTPMVDVMLVLLVIFMVTAPLLVAGLPVELPRTTAPRLSQPKKPVIVTLAADGSLSIRDERVDRVSFVPSLAAIRSAEGDSPVYVRADRTVPYGGVMELLALVSNAGYNRISLLSQPAHKQAEASGQNGTP